MPHPTDSWTRYYRAPAGAPQAQPISRDDVKAALRIDHADDDALIDQLIAAAIARLEGSGKTRDGYLGQALITQTWRLETFAPNKVGILPIDYGPIQSVTSVETMLNGAYSTWPAAAYRLAQRDGRGAIVPNYGYAWPLRDLREDAIRVTFVAGFGDAPADVPAHICRALILDVGRRYDPERDTPDTDRAITNLLSPHRVIPI